MGMDYIKIHTCHDNCILYCNECKKLNECLKCVELHYKFKDSDVVDDDYDNDGDDNGVSKKSPLAKVMWYLPK